MEVDEGVVFQAGQVSDRSNVLTSLKKCARGAPWWQIWGMLSGSMYYVDG